MPVTLDRLLALFAFAFVAAMTPGPNNIMLLASGVNFGFRRTIPHMLGVGIGFVVMVLAVGLGLGRAFEAAPALHGVLKLVGALYLLWLAWRLANAGPARDDGAPASGRPLGFWAAAAFQWVNPKAWIMAVSATATYAQPGAFAASVLLIAAVLGIVTIPSVTTWTLFGAGLRPYLSAPKTMRWFNRTMALLLVASLWPLVADLGR